MRKRDYTAEDYASFFQKGEERGFDHFFQQYYPSLSFYAASFVKEQAVAEDIATEAFLKTWQRHAQLGTPGAIKAYLYTIVKNDSLNYLDKQKRIAASQAKLKSITDISEEAHLHQLIRAETMKILHEAIHTLAPECRKVFSLMFIEGKSTKEIAETLQISRSTVKAQKARGIMLLRKKLQGGF